MVYAIVRAGGRQEKVSVGDVLEIDRVQAAPGDSVELPVLLLVDGTDVTSDQTALAKATVTVEVVAATKGPKINILKYKNKTGYRKRQGHRQHHTRVLVTGIETGTKAAAKPTAETAPVETAPVETAPVETAPVETAPVETAPVETAPVETAPVETAPVEALAATTVGATTDAE